MGGGGGDKVGSWYPGVRVGRSNISHSYPMRRRLLALERGCQLRSGFVKVIVSHWQLTTTCSNSPATALM